MTRQDILKKKLPDTPGVYFFLGARRKILYIGRATSLRSRVRSYFSGDILESRSPWIAKMLPLIRSIDFRKTDSVLEAVLLETDLIKKFQPPYNTDEKDDKSFNYVVITKQDFPIVFIVRRTDIDFKKLTAKSYNLKAVFGPFPNGFDLRIAVKLIRRIFPYRDSKCIPLSHRACFNRQIGLCPGTCTGEISKKEYAKTIRNIRLFFEGKKGKLMSLLQREMKAAAKVQEFEKAGELKRQLFALKHIQDVAFLKKATGYERLTTNYRVEAYDLSHFGGKEIVGAMTVVVDGRATPSEYRLFKIRSIENAHEAAGLREILRRRFNHPEWMLPNLIVVDGNEVQKHAAEAELAKLGQKIPVVAVVKDEKHRPREILGLEHLRSSVVGHPRQSVLLANSEAHRFALKFQRKRRSLDWPRGV